MTELVWIDYIALFLWTIGRCLGSSDDFLTSLFAGSNVAQVKLIVVVRNGFRNRLRIPRLAGLRLSRFLLPVL